MKLNFAAEANKFTFTTDILRKDMSKDAQNFLLKNIKPFFKKLVERN